MKDRPVEVAFGQCLVRHYVDDTEADPLHTYCGKDVRADDRTLKVNPKLAARYCSACQSIRKARRRAHGTRG